MIIDLILDRKDGVDYSPKDFYTSVLKYGGSNTIAQDMDTGTEKEVKQALCKYIGDCGYNTEIMDYIKSVNWVDLYEVHAMLTLSNWGGLEISIDDSGDSVYCRMNFGGKADAWSEAIEIEYYEYIEDDINSDYESIATFQYNENVYKLDEFMRV